MSLKPQILYIEDDNDSQRLVSKLLQRYGYKVYTASDGLEGVNIAYETKPSLILMDINLPHINGRAVTTRLRSLEHLANTPIVALTADASAGSREMALAAGCTGYLNKPIDVDEFPKQIESFLQGQTHQLDEKTRSIHLEQHAANMVEQLEKKIRELEKANKMLYQLDRVKSDFIVLASHELYTPLTLVVGYASLLNDHLNPENGDVPLSQIRSANEMLGLSIKRMSGAVREIMSVARIASGKLDLSLGPMRLNEIISAIYKSIKGVLDDRHIEWVMADDLSQLPLIFGDGKQLRTAVFNVVENAIKYTPDGGRICIYGKLANDGVELAIADTGIGIAPEEQKNIFSQFYTLGKVDNHSTSKTAFDGGGMGLGLTISSGIIEAHNGRIWVESPGEDRDKLPGSTFYIWLPQQTPDL